MADNKKLLLLTAEPENWAPKQIVEKAKEAEFDVEIINPDLCYISLNDEPYISFKGTKFLGADICIPRLSEEHLDYKVSIINHIEEMGIKVLNKGAALKIASNKIETQIKLNAEGIKTPKTALFTSDEQLEYAIEAIGGKFPVIVKTIFGTHGIGVIRADSQASLKSIVQQMVKTNVEFMLQEYIEHDESARILLLNGEPLVAVMRTIPKGDFRSNAHLGAELKPHDATEKELEVVKKAAKTIGIDFAAVDYILVDDEVIVLEVNGSPGFESMQKVVKDIDIATKVIEHCSSLIGSSTTSDETKAMVPVEITGDNNQIEVEIDGIPAQEEEEEEEEKVVDVDHEDAKELDKKELKKDDADDKEDVKDVKDVSPHHNIIDPELLDNAHEKIIGTVTSVIIKHFNDEAPIEARVDTGANTSSIAGEDIKIEDNSVKFKFNDTTYRFHLLRKAKIKQADSDKVMERPVIRVDIEINGIHLRNVEMNVNTRADMNFPILLGRQTLAQTGLLINPASNNIDAVNAYITTKNNSQKEEE